VLGIADIADELDMSRSTTRRYVLTLTALGYLEQGSQRKYRLGLRVTDLGLSALNGTGLREHAHSYLEELRQRSTYTASLAVLDGSEIVYVDRARSLRRGQSEIDLGLAPGSRLPAYCTAMGKLLLANLPDTERREILTSMKLTKRGPNTITSKEALRDELAEVREGSTTRSSRPSCTRSPRPCATRLVKSSPLRASRRIPRRSHSRSSSTHSHPHLVSTADRISARLGYRRDDE
jgi:IclR family pca regulon transcriptional regulator